MICNTEKMKLQKRRTYSSIHSIIAAKATDVIELYVNEELILNKIQEEKSIQKENLNNYFLILNQKDRW